MFQMGLGALLIICGFLYMARTAIWRGSLSRPARGTLEAAHRRDPGTFKPWDALMCECWGGPERELQP